MTVYVYRWRTDDPRCSPPEWAPKRPTLHGRRCRVLARGRLNSALVEFVDDGQRDREQERAEKGGAMDGVEGKDWNQIVEFFRCSCGSEGLLLSRFTDETDVYLTMLEWRGGARPSFRDRLRHAWRIIRRGYASEDDLILKAEDARRLAAKLIEFSTPYIPAVAELAKVVSDVAAQNPERWKKIAEEPYG